jgi:hypothetical protein
MGEKQRTGKALDVDLGPVLDFMAGKGSARTHPDIDVSVYLEYGLSRSQPDSA